MLGHLIYNHQHLDDARIQQEISKSLYPKSFDGVHLVHAYNGKKEFGYKPYLEDKLLTLGNRGHFRGAADLINAGLEYFSKKKIPGLKYVLVTAADTWMLDGKFLSKLVGQMESEGRVLAVSSWGRAKYPERPTGFSTDFFVIDIEWNRKSKLFPVDYDSFAEKFLDIFALQYAMPTLEGAVQFSFQKYILKRFVDNETWTEREKMLRRIIEREPVHLPTGERIGDWPDIGLYTSPEPMEKKKILKKLRYDFGPCSHKLMTAKDTGYFNGFNSSSSN